jgi:hypothetical protein
LKIKFTVQDPCQIVGKSYGDHIAEDLRFVVKTVVGGKRILSTSSPTGPTTIAVAVAAFYSRDTKRSA